VLPTSALPQGAKSVGNDMFKVSTGLDLDENGRLVISAANGSPLDPRAERTIREEHRDRLESWLSSRCDEINSGFEQLLTIHCGAPRPDLDHRLPPEVFAKPSPVEPTRPSDSGWDRIFPWRKRAREARFEQSRIEFQHDLEVWEAARAEHARDWECRRKRTEDERRTSPEVMHDLLAEALSAIAWPRETLVRFEIEPDLVTLRVEVDLPEIEDMPAQHAAVAARGLKLNLHERSESQVRKAYATHIHGVVFRVVGEGFAVLPTVKSITCSGFSQRVDNATGTTKDDYLISLRAVRDTWARIDFANLAQVDPVTALSRFDMRSDCSASGRMSAITPFEE
jgi:hypothetical protein